MLKRFREEELLGKPLSEKQKEEIARAQSDQTRISTRPADPRQIGAVAS
ncbi:MAG TPA: hypothetical protein VM120_23440 [Bryobacteraceae bacterium]|nr:hypothetical protein [Bryobacteraceae bacterium]